MRDEDGDTRAKPKTVHEIGCDLATISVEELRNRVRLLEDEIARLKAEEARKLASREAASAFFRS